jgi:cobalamin synthase
VVLGLGSALVLAKLAASQIGGYTGDVLGAAEVLAECVVLTAAASVGGA